MNNKIGLYPCYYLFHSVILFHVLHLSRERVCAPKEEVEQHNDLEGRNGAHVATSLQSPPRSTGDSSENANGYEQNGPNKANYSARSLLKSASISASKCIVVKPRNDLEVKKLTKEQKKTMWDSLNIYTKEVVLYISSILMFVLNEWQEEPITETNDEAVDGLSQKVSALHA